MRPSLNWWNPTTFAWLTAAAMLAATALGPLVGAPAAFRTLHLGLASLALLGWCLDAPRWAQPLSRGSWRALLAASLVWLEAAAFTHFFDFQVPGVDFSIFDWMLHSTANGRLAYSPIYDVNHLGVHSSFALLLLTPLHVVAPSPLWLLALGPLLVWLGLFPLRALVRWASGEEHGAFTVFATLALVSSAWVGPLVDGGFRIEGAMPCFTLVFLCGWALRRKAWWWAGALLLLATKEDSALFVSTFAIAAALVERSRWRQSLGLTAVSLGWLALYTQLLQPRLLGKSPEYLGFWSEYGTSLSTVAVGMALQPLHVLARVASSGVWRFFLPMALLPWASARAAAAMAPVVVLLGAATFEYMHGFGGYYAAPLIAFALFGALDVLHRWKSRGALKRWQLGVPLFALALFPLFHRTDIRVTSVNAKRVRGMEAMRLAAPVSTRWCVQSILFPHVGYPEQVAPLFTDECARTDAALLVNPSLEPWPFTRDELQRLVSEWKQDHEVREFDGGFVLLTKRLSAAAR